MKMFMVEYPLVVENKRCNYTGYVSKTAKYSKPKEAALNVIKECSEEDFDRICNDIGPGAMCFIRVTDQNDVSGVFGIKMSFISIIRTNPLKDKKLRKFVKKQIKRIY